MKSKEISDEVNKRKRIEGYHLSEKSVIIRALEKKFGSEVIEIIEKVRAQRMQNIWQNIASKMGDNSIKSLIDNLWDEDFFEYTYETCEGGETKMNVTWCLFAELAYDLNLQDVAYHLYCVDDPHIVTGFNPDIGFKRTKTLMQGHECCDHCYWMKK